MTTGMTIAAAVVVLALPSAVLAFGTKFQTEVVPASAPKVIDALQEGGARAGEGGPRLARGLSLPLLGRGQFYPFTPAKNPNRPDRSVTVAVRLDAQALKTITVFGKPGDSGNASEPTLRIAQTGFNLGVARGYRNFAQDLAAVAPIVKSDTPDITRYSMAPGVAHEASRFSPRIAADNRQPAGRTPRTFGDKDEPVDLGGSYRVTRNLDVTAGVRYSQDRERLKPLTDGNQDNQAVYVGTQFRF